MSTHEDVKQPDILDPHSIYGWCMVPYTDRPRTGTERAQILSRLGLRGAAWDWRPEHVADFPAELDAYEAAGLKLLAVWIPALLPKDDDELGDIDSDALAIISECARRGLTPQLWTCTSYGPPGPYPPAGEELDPIDQHCRVQRTASHLAPLASLAAEHGMTVALYNHQGWFGEPENQLAVADALGEHGLTNVGLTYQFHHGHAHIDRFAQMWPLIAPRVVALGLSGMMPEAHWGGRKIHPLGHGVYDERMLRTVLDSGWSGPVTVLCHTMDDPEVRLRDNLDGLAWLRARLAGQEAPDAPPTARIPEPRWPH
jgi:sugar phosphate isomerase/epimerase